jgi:hypothetical protein
LYACSAPVQAIRAAEPSSTVNSPSISLAVAEIPSFFTCSSKTGELTRSVSRAAGAAGSSPRSDTWSPDSAPYRSLAHTLATGFAPARLSRRERHVCVIGIYFIGGYDNDTRRGRGAG